MKKIMILVVIVTVIYLVICGLFIYRNKNGESFNMLFRKNANDDGMIHNVSSMGNFPNELKDIPSEYFVKSDQQGKIEDLYYDTYESFSYEQKVQKLNKHALVYLPYGYDDNKEYPVIYLMHGGWSNENTFLRYEGFNNVFDNAMANGDIVPSIIVTPTYNNTSEKDSGDYSLALQLTNNYHNELTNDLIPAIDSKYSTIADRDHRAFVGFSMGSMATWRTFQYALDYFRYFMPSSGGPAYDVNTANRIVKDSGYGENDFFIFAASGTEDFAYSGFKSGVYGMINSKDGVFKFSNNEKEGNIYFLEKEGATHDGNAAMLYFYNGLSSIWKESTSDGVITNSNDFKNNFEIDDVLSINNRNIHHSRYIPKDIDVLESVDLYITLPGWEGLYFQGAGANLVEDFYWIARDMNPNMIILAPQLDDWGEQSADDTILLTEYYKENYNVRNIYINGLSGGGETLSLVLDKRPDLYTKALLVSSKWDGGYENVVNAKVPLYFFIGESDSYYGSANFKETYRRLYTNYENQGLSDNEIDELLILDVRDHEYFTSRGYEDEHAGCGLAAHEEDIMKWLLEV